MSGNNCQPCVLPPYNLFPGILGQFNTGKNGAAQNKLTPAPACVGAGCPQPLVQITPAANFMMKSGLNDEYTQWKNGATYDDYVKAKKYFSWKDASRGNTNNWDTYGEWKNAVWKGVSKDMYQGDYGSWKTRVDWDDYMKWKEWNNWKSEKSKVDDNYKPIKKRDLDRKVKRYEKWVKGASL